MQFLIITGMSGAGKSLCVKYFEDIGYFCVDNLPPSLIPKFAEICLQGRNKMEKIALIMGNTNNLYELQSVIKSRT